MHTVMVIGGGTARAAATGAVWFIPFWLGAAGFNLSIGVEHGYSVAEELPIALVVFGVPAGIASTIWVRFSRGS